MLSLRTVLWLVPVLALAVSCLATETAAQQNFYKKQFRDQDRQQRREQFRQNNPEAFEQRQGQQRGEWDAHWKHVLALYNDGRYAEAEAAARSGIARATAQFGPNHRTVGRGYHELGRIFHRLGRSQEAEQYARRALAIREREVGASSEQVAGTLTSLGAILIQQNRYAEAEAVLNRAAAIAARVGTTSAQTEGGIKRFLGVLYTQQGRLADAETMLREALALQERQTGAESIWTVRVLRALAYTVHLRGRPAEAEAIYKRAVASSERASGKDRSELGDALRQLAGFYVDQGRLSEAEPIFKRAMAAYEAAHGTASLFYANAILGLADLYLEAGRLADAEPLARQALAIIEAKRGASHSGTSGALASLGSVLLAAGRHEEAEPVLRRALEIREKVFGPEHAITMRSVIALGRLYTAADRLGEAEAMLTRALAMGEKAVGPDHPRLAAALRASAQLQLKVGRTQAAVASLQRASEILSSRTRATAGALNNRYDSDVNPKLRHSVHALLVSGAWRRIRESPGLEAELANEALIAAQLALNTTTGAAVSQMSVRFAAESDALADLLRRGQDLANRRQELDKELTQGLGGDFSDEDVRTTARDRAVLRKEIDRLSTEITEVSRRLQKEFPDYAALARSDPLGVADIQALLGPDEAVVSFLTLDQATFVWAITRDGARWHRAEIGEQALARDVETLRCGLEAEAWLEARRNARCKELGLALTSAELLPYDLSVAHRLYARLMKPVEGLIAGKSLILVPSGPLTSLSFHALLTEPPATALPDAAGYKAAPWLVKRHALTVIPSLPSLKALRQTAKVSAAPKPLIGYAAPVFGNEAPQQVATLTTASTSKRALLSPTRAFTSFYSGGRANLDALRQGLVPLPETEDELRAVARSVNASDTDLLIGPAATEAALKAARLADYRIVYFATHGLIAGEVEGLSEPALALTLPKTASEADDGLLTASEVARLKLNADWVVLSACNTAAGTKPGAEALSGLARAFFYAGARALLVSHWRVNSEAAVRLTTATFSGLAAKPELGRAEALRSAMLAVLAEGEGESVHPAYWAPFVVVGDNRSR